MEIAKVLVSGVKAERVSGGEIPAGIIGGQVAFQFGSGWEGLKKTVVFRGCQTKDVLNAGDLVTIPPETVAQPGGELWVGVYGVDGENTVVIPTLWANLGRIRAAADPSGDSQTKAVLPVWAQIQADLGDLESLETQTKESLVAAVNELAEKEAEISREDVESILEAYLEENSTAVEPGEEDIPKVFFGEALPQTKTETVMPFRYISKTMDIGGYCETKAQGNSSMSYPKKNQTVKLYKDAACSEKRKVNFKGWGKQSKFCCKANWIDLSHARNVVSARLWADMMQSRENYAELPELLRTSPNQGAVDGFPIKVYAGGVYQGRYTLNIPKDKWMANMDDDLEEHCILCGENYVSSCFRASANIDGNDWTDEIHDTVPEIIKTRWNEVISFVRNSTDTEFKEGLGDYFDVPSLIDYHLFGLLSCGLDAYGKNQIYLTYDGQKWIAMMYDMDATWGLYWDGSKFVSAEYSREEYEDMVSGRQGNLLYMRLEQLFPEELQSRWTELKSGALSIANVINRFERFMDICPSGLVAEDYASSTGGGSFTGIPSQTENNIQQIRAFALARHTWCDDYLAALASVEEVACTGITLSASELTFTETASQTLTVTLEPENTTDTVEWTTSDASVATVEDGVVTPVGTGSATITAAAGTVSAACAVTVESTIVSCTGVTLSGDTLTFDGTGSQTLTATVTPEDTTDTLVWSSSDTSVATVDDGVVTAVGNGEAVITASCGSCSAECSVTVSGINVIAYTLAEETEFDGSSTCIDTGIQLFDTEKDWTILLALDMSQTQSANSATVFHCMNEVSPWPGLSMQYTTVATTGPYVIGGVPNSGDPNYATNIPTSTTRLAIKCVQGIISKISYFDGSAVVDATVRSAGYTQVTQNLLLGCYQTATGTKGRYWKGTISQFAVYSKQLSDEEIQTFLGGE